MRPSLSQPTAATKSVLPGRALHVAAFLLVCYVITSCGPSRIYEQDYPLAENVWKQDSALIYRFEVKEADKPYDLFYHVRYDLDYPYYNLYVKLSIEDDTAGVMMETRHDLILLDPQTGKPSGSGLGGVYDQEFTALRQMRFAKPGTYKVRLAQYMRLAAMQGIHSVGIRVSESEEKEQGK